MEQLKVNIITTDEKLIPTYSTVGSSGFDLKASADYVIKPGDTILIDTGISVELPSSYEIQVRPRSGLSYKTKLRVILGTVDSDYTGIIKVIATNTGDEPINILKYDRIAQGVVSRTERVKFIPAEDISPSERGSNGFGSSGVR